MNFDDVEGTKKQYDDLDRLPWHRVPVRPLDRSTVRPLRKRETTCAGAFTHSITFVEFLLRVKTILGSRLMLGVQGEL